MTQPPPPDDTWPTPDEATVLATRDTVVGAPPPEPVAPPGDRRIGAGMLLGLAAVALVAVGILIAYLLTHRDAKQNATTVVVTRSPTTVAAAAQVAVPDLTGQSLTAAETQLRAAGLSSTKTEVSSDQTSGTVVAQTPPAGAKAAKGSVVTLSVAKHQTTTPTTTSSATTTSPAPPATPANATMPDVTGQTEQAAVTALDKAGILASLVFVPAQDPLGTVVKTAKAAGTTVVYHSHVQVNLSQGSSTNPDVSVPNAIGQTLTQAVSTMNGVKLRLIYVKLPVTSKSQAGTIVQQSPLEGGKAPQNAQILVFLGAFVTR